MSGMTLLVASIAATSPQEAAADISAAVAAGCDAIELRVDHLGDSEDVIIRSVAESRPAGMPLILTIRSAAEGGAWDGDEVERMSRLIALAPSADYIDVEWATWQKSANIRQKIGLALGEEAAGRRMILSMHDFNGRPAKLMTTLAAMLDEERAEVVKLVWRARTVRDNFEAIELVRSAPRPVTALCMGENGGLSRVLARKFGGFAVYAAVAAERLAAPGQLTLGELKGLYRWDAIGEATRVYGLAGWPVEHSLSPHLHNAGFSEAGVDAVYVPLAIEPAYESLKAFVVEALARPWSGLGGLSVTIPHKEHTLRLTRELGGEVDSIAERIGAANTLAVLPNGKLSASNTDCAAAMESIVGLLDRRDGKLTDLSCVVLGAGGVARAIVAGLTAAGAQVRIFNRDAERARGLAEAFGGEWGSWEQRSAKGAALLVNATSVGMYPAVDETPLAVEGLEPGLAVFDTIYNPMETRLVREAAGVGCRVVGGLEMFIEQAARQFETWTGRAAPRETFARVARGRLQDESGR